MPFEDFVIHLRGGDRAPLANPLACGPAIPSAQILPYSGQSAAEAAAERVLGQWLRAPSLPFSLGQTLVPEDPRAGAFSPFSFSLSRADAQQYLSRVTVTLPPGLVGAIPTVPLCSDAQANAGTCPATSQIGTVAVAAGAGGEPYALAGQASISRDPTAAPPTDCRWSCPPSPGRMTSARS